MNEVFIVEYGDKYGDDGHAIDVFSSEYGARASINDFIAGISKRNSYKSTGIPPAGYPFIERWFTPRQMHYIELRRHEVLP